MRDTLRNCIAGADAFLTLNGVTHHYNLRRGGGPVVVFSNSLGTDFRIWDEVIARLPANWTCLTYDKRGHGLTGGGGVDGIDSLAADLAALMDALALKDATIVGLSVGGMIAQTLGATRPDLASRLVLSNTGHRIATPEMWQERMDLLAKVGLDGMADAILERWFSNHYRQHQTEALAGYRMMLTRTPQSGYGDVCAAIAAADLTERTRSLTQPTVCIGGTEDQSTPPALMEELTGLIGGATLHIIDGVGHLPCIETPDRVAAIIRDHVATTAISRYDQGMATRRSVLGDAHVDRAEAAKTALDLAFQTLITEGAWGTVWASDHLTRRERSMLTLALLAATGNFEEIPMHIRATAHTGASPEDVAEAMQHVAIYAGVPRANHGLKLAKQTYAEMEANG